ncbi:MAG: hypothetical protein LBP61_10380 [Desulfovibrio sp.]|jgi:hypothetical protein|nr:hypothetical protein [Desulfovibrio sp.]
MQTGLQASLLKERPTKAFVSVLVFGCILYFLMKAVQSALPSVLFDYALWWKEIEHSALYRFLWMIGDATEPHFHKTLLGGLGVTVGSFIAYRLDKARSPKAGTPVCYGTGLWPWVFASSVFSLGLSILLFGGLRNEDGWVPTFVPYVSVAGCVILLYGGGMANMLTGAFFGALLTVPITLFLRQYVCLPMNLPGVIGSVSGMWLGGILVFELCHILPWMRKLPPPPGEHNAGAAAVTAMKRERPNEFFVRRMIADYSEPMFVGNEIAGACLILGSMLTWLLSPNQPYYGTGWFPALIFCQIITGAIALYAYWPGWRDGDFFPSFVPVVSVAPGVVLAHGPSLFVIVCSAVLGGLLSPPVANMANRCIPAHWHPMIGFTFSMAFCTLVVSSLIKYLLMAFPFLGSY